MFWTFIVLGIVMWLLQGLLNIYQLKKFNKELKNLRQSGRVAIGKARGRFKAGCLLLLCIDDDCKIITGKKLQGVTSFARFKDFNELNGYYLPEITEKDCQNFDKQTSSAILSAVEEYKQYTKQQKEASTCIEIGILINFIGGVITDFTTAYVSKQQGVVLSDKVKTTH